MPNKGDTAWLLVSTAFVILMTLPGLALCYGGLVRKKVLKALGLDEARLQALGQASMLVVRVPYQHEALCWEGRIFPWEYLLAAATREQRRAAPSGPLPLTVIRELQVQHEIDVTAGPGGPGVDQGAVLGDADAVEERQARRHVGRSHAVLRRGQHEQLPTGR